MAKSKEVRHETTPVADPTIHVDLGAGFVYPVKSIQISMVDPATGKPSDAIQLFKPHSHPNGQEVGKPANGFEISGHDMLIKINGDIQINLVVATGPPRCPRPPCPPEPSKEIVGDIKLHFKVKIE